jgi:hypothetical protein
MERNSITFKSSPLFGISFILFGIFIASFTILFVQSDIDSVRKMSIFMIILGVIAISIGYKIAEIKKITINDFGIIFKHGRKIIFFRKWNEISKIQTYEIYFVEVGYVYFLEIFFIDQDKFRTHIGVWGKQSFKTIFKILSKYQEKYHFIIEDKINWERL